MIKKVNNFLIFFPKIRLIKSIKSQIYYYIIMDRSIDFRRVATSAVISYRNLPITIIDCHVLYYSRKWQTPLR